MSRFPFSPSSCSTFSLCLLHLLLSFLLSVFAFSPLLSSLPRSFHFTSGWLHLPPPPGCSCIFFASLSSILFKPILTSSSSLFPASRTSSSLLPLSRRHFGSKAREKKPSYRRDVDLQQFCWYWQSCFCRSRRFAVLLCIFVISTFLL